MRGGYECEGDRERVKWRERRKNIIHTKNLGYLYWIIRVRSGWAGFKNLNPWYLCQRTISTQKLKLLGEVSGYDLYYSLTHLLKWKPFGFETCTTPHYLVLNFYQINGDGEIRTRDRLVIKALIPCQRTISTQKLKLLGEVLGYDLYYYLKLMWTWWSRCHATHTQSHQFPESLLYQVW